MLPTVALLHTGAEQLPLKKVSINSYFSHTAFLEIKLLSINALKLFTYIHIISNSPHCYVTKQSDNKVPSEGKTSVVYTGGHLDYGKAVSAETLVVSVA